MTTQEILKYWLDSLKNTKYQLLVLKDALNNALEHIENLEVGIRLSPLYKEDKGDK